MNEQNPLYTFAIKPKNEAAYVIPYNVGGIPVFNTLLEAERDFRMFKADKKLTNLDGIILDISNLVKEGIISTTFGEGARS